MSYVHHNVEPKESELGGLGLFAKGPVKEGEIVTREKAELYQGLHDVRPGLKILTLAQMHERYPDTDEFEKFIGWYYQMGEQLFVGPLTEKDVAITTLQNHSCDPNCWWTDEFTLVARRDIKAGEEVTFDYGSSESEPNPTMTDCLCGSPLCRGKVTPEDYLLPELQERYGNHMMGYLLERIAALKLEKEKLSCLSDAANAQQELLEIVDDAPAQDVCTHYKAITS